MAVTDLWFLRTPGLEGEPGRAARHGPGRRYRVDYLDAGGRPRSRSFHDEPTAKAFDLAPVMPGVDGASNLTPCRRGGSRSCRKHSSIIFGVLMDRRGRKRRLDIESEYWLLLASGVGTKEACNRLGIGRKTGYRWRAENGGLPPAVLSESNRSLRYLSF